MAYVFKDKKEAYELKRMAQHSLGSTGSPIVPTGNEVVIVKAPTAGIVAMSGVEITSGVCTRMFLNTGLDPVEVTERTEFELDVFNTTAEDIVGDSYFQAARCGEAWISVAGGGSGGGSGDQMFQLQNAAEISAASGFAFGTGSASLLKINIGATAYEDAGEPAVAMINPFEEAIPSGAMITAYKKDSYVRGRLN